MEAKKEHFFDKPMMLTLLAVCCIVLFIFHADRNKLNDTDVTVMQRDTVEIVIQDSYSLTSSE